MASLYIQEFQGVGYPQLQNSFIGAALSSSTLPSSSQPVIPISGSPTLSNAFALTTILIRVHSDAICSIAIGGSPVATTSNMRLAANQTEYFGVKLGDYLSVIANV
jgi:hypothetical protein